MKIFQYIGPADYITLINGLMGFLAIMYIIDYNFKMAFIFLLVVMILDGIDGWIARYLGSSKELGKYLDSISDTVSFSFAPAILIYATFYNLSYTSFNYWPNAAVVFTCFIIVGFGMLRLAWFIEYGQKFKYFHGLPTPALALFVIILLQPQLQLWLDQIVTLFAVFIVTIITVADVKYPKFQNIPMAATAGCLILIMIFVIALEPAAVISYAVILITLCMLMIYILLGPITVEMKYNKDRLPVKSKRTKGR